MERPADNRIFLSPPHLMGREKDLLVAALDSGWIAPVGPELAAFEAEVARRAGVAHCVALSSGTAALHLALRSLGVGAGDRVFTSTLSFVASANAIVYQGAIPVFIDSSHQSWNLCPSLLGEALDEAARKGELPKAILVVDLYGQCADYEAIREVAAPYEIPIVEDAAEALGATYRQNPAGSLGDIGAFSFNGNKIITTSGGGMLATDNPAWAETARHLSSQARQPTLHYEHEELGYNYRLSNLLAAVGRAQLETLDRRLQRKREINEYYRERLCGIDGLEFMPVADYGSPNYWLTCLTIDPRRSSADRSSVIAALADDNIESRPVWKPMHQQPLYRDAVAIGGALADQIFASGLCLPSGTSLTDGQLDRICSRIRAVLIP